MAQRSSPDAGVTQPVHQEGEQAVGLRRALPSIVVLTARNGQIIRLRDYVSLPAAAAAMGREI